MIEKLKVFQSVVIQTFDYCYYEHKWFKKITRTDNYEAIEKARYILAKDETEAIEIYKQRYKWEFDYPIETFWSYDAVGMFEDAWLSENPNFKHEVRAIEKHPSFEFLKNNLRAEELLSFCKQEMYPIEVLIK